MASAPYSFFRRPQVLVGQFVSALFAVGWRAAIVVFEGVLALRTLFVTAWATAFPYPRPALYDLAAPGVIHLGLARTRAYEARRLERGVDRDMALGVGLRLSA